MIASIAARSALRLFRISTMLVAGPAESVHE
jgi:hypothetical protein